MSILPGFVLTGTSIDAAEAMLSLKGIDFECVSYYFMCNL